MERLPRRVNPDAQSSGQRWLKQRHTFLLKRFCAQLGLYDRITLGVFSVTDMSDYYRALLTHIPVLRPQAQQGGWWRQRSEPGGASGGRGGAGSSPQVGASVAQSEARKGLGVHTEPQRFRGASQELR